MPNVDLTGHPEISSTFHFPCHGCGQAVDVVDGQRQPHECQTFDNDIEKLCAAHWAGYERGGQTHMPARLEADITAIADALERWNASPDESLVVATLTRRLRELAQRTT